jgi:uncharacterized protein (TIGR02266 family)
MQSDRREAPRVPFVLRVGGAGSVQLEGATEDLSVGGVFLRTERVFAPGDRLTLSLSFPSLLEPVAIEVEVVRMRPGGPGVPPGVAVRVPPERAADREKLRRLAEARAQVEAGRVTGAFRVLVAEDTKLIAEMYGAALRRLEAEGQAVTVEIAPDGEAARERLRRMPVPDLLICDLYMPRLDGFALMEWMRATPAVARVPVVVVTAAGAEQRDRANRLGACLYLEKPVKFLDIVATARALLGLRATG